MTDIQALKLGWPEKKKKLLSNYGEGQ